MKKKTKMKKMKNRQEKKKRGRKGVPPETAQKKYFLVKSLNRKS